jgi:LysM repeat protein
MKRITIFIATLAAGFISLGNMEAQTVRALEARILDVESRLAIIESKLAGNVGASTLTNTLKNDFQLPEPTSLSESYVIRDGDSVGGIARKFGIPRQALLDANNMAEGQPIYIGETLVIPSAPNHDNGPIAGDGMVHTVRAGDTLSGISRKYRTTIAAIKQRNGLSSDVIGMGQKLVIPGVGNVEINPDPGFQNLETSSNSQFQYDNPLLSSNETYGYYAVQTGDNLYALARDFFTTMKELQRLNGLKNSTIIHPGDELIVPTSKYNDYHQNVAKN